MMLYNQKQTVSRAIESILNQQTSYSFEIIIGDDCSTDGTRQVVEEYQLKYPNCIKLNERHPNYGIPKNYQDCLSRCSGEFLMGCSGDDWWHNSNKLQIQIEYMENHPECVLHYGGFIEYYPATGKRIKKMPIKSSEPLFESVLCVNPVCALTACVRMSAMRKIGYEDFVKQGFLVEDWPKWLGLSLIGKFSTIDIPLATYSLYKGSAHNCITYKRRLEYIENYNKIRLYFANKAGKIKELSDIIHDMNQTQIGEAGIIYGERLDALKAFKLIRKRNLKIRIKTLICRIPILFNILNARYNKNM